MVEILTIGASTHSFEHFLGLLSQHAVSVVADVRSVPASRFTPQFNRESLRPALEQQRIQYLFLGGELGARSSDPQCYVDGKVQYARLARAAEFTSGLERLIEGARHEHISIMCTEQEPLDCHRTVLVSRALADRGVEVAHIHGDGSIESHHDAMNRLRAGFGLDQPTLLDTDEDLLSKALALQEAKIAYVDKSLAVGR